MGLLDALQDIFNYFEDMYTFEEMAGEAIDYWYGAADTGNPGAASIAYDYCIPTAEDVIESWADDWPDVYTGEFSDACYDSHEAAWDCWSGTIEEIQAIIDAWAEEAGASEFDLEGEEGDDGGDEEGEE